MRDIDFLLDIEKEAVKIQKQQQENGSDPSAFQDRIVKLQQDYLGLVDHLGSIPGTLLEKINEACLDVYKERYELIDKGIQFIQHCKNDLRHSFRVECLGPYKRGYCPRVLRSNDAKQHILF